ncbi:hypothetical protein THOM_1612 [Trachipleistophora hominis]|uniref:Uncharacterized protein n=1 Tax=Trachipleistophora hominis TaxID=72359 RepID=L7JVG3_TRAHO|nr:hypothetical protein THOM_1612 [Trachipleistophora hominis]
MRVMPNKRVKSNSGASPYAHDSTYILHDKNVLDNEDKKSLFINDPLMTQYSKKVFLKISGLIGSTRSTDIPSYDHNTNNECTNVINDYERIGTRGTDAKNEYGNMISIYSDLKRVMDAMAMYRYENRNKDGSKEMDEVIEDSQYVEDLFRNVARNMVVKYTRRNVGCEMKEGFYLCNECMERYVMAERYHESRSVVKKNEDVLNKADKNEDDSVKVGGTITQKNAVSDIKDDGIGYKTDEVENNGVEVVQTGKDLKRVVTANENTEKDLNKVEKAEEETLEEKEGVAKKELPEWLVNGKAADLNGAKLQGKVSAMDKMEEQTAKDMNGKENIEKALKVVNMAMNITKKSEKELNTNINGEIVNEITKVNEMLEKKDNSKQKTDESVTHSGKKRCLLGERTVGPPHFKIKVVRNNKDGDYFVYKPEPREKKSVLLGFEAITNEILKENKAFNTFQGGIKMRKGPGR